MTRPPTPGLVADEPPSPFRQRLPWIGGDLQTVRNYLVRPPASPGGLPATRIEIPMKDGTGDRLVAMLDRPEAPVGDRSLVVLIHGLTGCQDSFYILNSARFWLDRGHGVLRLNLRGAGPSRGICSEQYHAGRSSDVAAALASIDPEWTEAGILAIGYSLGGNVLLKHLGEKGRQSRVRFAASVSAPIDLAASALRFHRVRNRPYERWLLSRMKAEATAAAASLSAGERRAIGRARSVREFDDVHVAPRNGFDGVGDYYARCSAKGFLAGVEVPTLLLQARDDPWIPAAPYDAIERSGNRHLTVLVSDRGGHVGFHSRGTSIPWHDRTIAAWMNRLSVEGR